MSIMRCDKHDWFWDSDEFDGCPKCENEPILRECDCCGQMKDSVIDLFVSYMGDTSACASCRYDVAHGNDPNAEYEYQDREERG